MRISLDFLNNLHYFKNILTPENTSTAAEFIPVIENINNTSHWPYDIRLFESHQIIKGDKMKKIEIFSFVTCPLIFCLVLIFTGIYATNQRPELPQGIILICSGIICACFYGTNSLLAKIINNK